MNVFATFENDPRNSMDMRALNKACLPMPTTRSGGGNTPEPFSAAG